jgi:hypothetical protein
MSKSLLASLTLTLCTKIAAAMQNDLSLFHYSVIAEYVPQRNGEFFGQHPYQKNLPQKI